MTDAPNKPPRRKQVGIGGNLYTHAASGGVSDPLPKNKILLLEDNPADVVLTKQYFQRAENFPYTLTICTNLRDGLSAISGQTFDAALVDLYLPDSAGLATVQQMVTARPSLPVLVLTNYKDRETAIAAVKHGAQDYLVKSDMDGEKLVTALQMALARQRCLSGEVETLASFPFRVRAATTSRLYGMGPLKETHPVVFGELVKSYAQALEQAVEASPFGEDPGNRARLMNLAEVLGRLKAGPNDVVDMHTEAFKIKSKGAVVEKVEALAREGRLTLVQAMGFLVFFYRKYCQDQPGLIMPRPPQEPKKTEESGG